MDGINQILRYVQWALLPTAVLLAFSQFHVQDTTVRAIAGVVAGVVAMVPEGLVLLTSLAFGVAAVTLARRQVLVQELPAVEGLARVDVVLLDKTGTLTEGAIRFHEVHELAPDDPVCRGARRARRRRQPQRDDERAVRGVPRARGLGAHRGDAVLVGPQVERGDVRRRGARGCSARPRWCGPIAPPTIPVRADADRLAAEGQRVLLLAHTDAALVEEELPDGLHRRRRCSCSRSRSGPTRPTRCSTSPSRACGAW